jgi:hypothetical protein
MNILYVILHGSTSKHRYESVTQTWGKNKNIIFYSDYQDLDKKIYKVSDRADYHSNEEKHLNALLLVANSFYDYDWFFFCDDDTFVNTKNLENSLFDINLIHGSIITGCWPRDKNLIYCSGGAGYLISKNILLKIVQNMINATTGFSDVSLGIIAEKANIKFLDNEKFKSQNQDFFKIEDKDVKNYFTFHYVKTKEDQLRLLNLV